MRKLLFEPFWNAIVVVVDVVVVVTHLITEKLPPVFFANHLSNTKFIIYEAVVLAGIKSFSKTSKIKCNKENKSKTFFLHGNFNIKAFLDLNILRAKTLY